MATTTTTTLTKDPTQHAVSRTASPASISRGEGSSYLGLKNSADVRALAILSAKFAWVAAHWALFPYLGKWAWLLTPIGFVPAFLTCCITHNAMHCNMFHNWYLETGFRAVLSVGLGHPVQLYIPTHNHNHHVHTQTPEDHIRTDKVAFRFQPLNFLLYFFHIIPAVAEVEGEYIRELLRKRPPALAKVIIQAVTLYGTWALLISQGGIQRFLACVYLPGYLGIYGILTMNILQHDGCSVSEARQGKNMDPNSARNFVDPSLNYFTMNNGYHSIHHMYPNKHWSTYAKLHEELIKPHIDPKLDEPSMIGYTWRTFFWPGMLTPANRAKKVE
mmetsp:Transcript_38454/g.46394  ORF Transcript_38454/g.46394 Transcript_38454/m.46394 type:complete len:331 (-) Transcript_38454:1002-1994(-)|eukprot:CAMPEP_0197858806 /NCGR_PEP_ID=MMETSP1438-20131217/32863_1 /TAXON_ID=1461541 /ORGANISM="Pterosperma sp., Strain CCMP1384" /LENGTH=330 /DNA_ID=CAMNT_0043475075 /DNA_START=125 /DNA_END=1117 /DNA_ORIENTATION=+